MLPLLIIKMINPETGIKKKIISQELAEIEKLVLNGERISPEQGLYLFEDDFTIEAIRKNFDFYEPMTVHESSLSPCVHAILASKLGYKERAYEFYLRTARLDLDDYNNDTEEGCHITSMAGTWMSVVKGFGGMKIKDGQLHLNPFLPDKWKSFSFRLEFRERVIKVKVSTDGIKTVLESGKPIEIVVQDEKIKLEAESS